MKPSVIASCVAEEVAYYGVAHANQGIGIAQGAEAAQINSKALKGEDTHLNAVGYRCGSTTRDQNDCWYREQDCLHCGKRGHKASVCRSKKMVARSKPRPPPNRSRQHSNSTYRGRPRNRVFPKDNKYVSTSIDPGEADEVSDSEYLPLYRVGEATAPPIKVSMLINS